MPSLDLPLKIGVLGGSISWGANLANIPAQRYSTLLERELNATVINAAVPATGVSTPSLCLELVLPEWRSLDVVVVEYNFNDAHSSTLIATVGGTIISALSSAAASRAAVAERAAKPASCDRARGLRGPRPLRDAVQERVKILPGD